MKDRDPSPLRDLLEPPPHVSRRCGARARTTGEPCRKWACKGRSRCRLHGGARGSGRPATSGKHTAEALRARRFLHVVRRLLARFYRRPEPIEVPMATEELNALVEQTILALRLAARSARRTSPPGEPDGVGEPSSQELLKREIAGAEAARSTPALLRPGDPGQIDAAFDSSSVTEPVSVPAAPSTRHSPPASRSSASRAPRRVAGGSEPRRPR